VVRRKISSSYLIQPIAYTTELSQLLHPYSTTDKITVLYISIFRLFDMKQEYNRFGLNDSKHSLNLICS
jgi:hypothetical protein